MSTGEPEGQVWLDDRWVPAGEARVSVFDRSFLYGDAVFETVRIAGGRPFLWTSHWRRFTAGLDALGLSLPASGAAVRKRILEGARRHALEHGVARLHRTRGCGPRGYSPAGCIHPTFLITFHPLPAPAPRPIRLHSAALRLPADGPLTRHKGASRLAWILARGEAEEAGADEALLRGEDGTWVEASSANLGWLEGGRVFTPPVSAGALPGITRAHVRRLARELGWAWRETPGEPARVLAADAVFLTSCAAGIRPVGSIDGHRVGDPGRLAPLIAARDAALRRFSEGR